LKGINMAISLKTQNLPTITVYVVWSLSLYAVFLTGDESSWQNITSCFDNFTAKDGMFAALTPIIVFVLSGILSADVKSIIVFWKIKNPLPGNRIFTELGPNDARIDMNKIKQIVGVIPTEPKEQNSLWYKYYKKHQEVLTVKTAHKHFLLARDMTATTLVMLILLPCSVVIMSKNWKGALVFLGILFGQYVLLTLTAQNNGKRFACNVLAEMCTSD
jgi:hypothetical protein